VRWLTGVAVAAVAALTAGLGVAAAPAADAAGRADDGPALSVSRSALDHSVRCRGDLSRSTPVLLVHGTFLTAASNFDWNYEPALDRQGRGWCTVDLPDAGLGDIQVAAEYVVHAIRVMHDRAGRRIDIIGFSQGGMIGRWALKYWPDTRRDVDDYVGIDGSNHGTLDAHAVCTAGCAPSVWQQRTGSRFLTALNSGPETFAGISYTEVYTLTDEVVVPNLPPAASSSLHGGQGRVANIAAQSICPVHLADHLTMGSVDPVAYAVAMDAITHDGPARAARIDRSVCTAATMPGVDPLTLPVDEARYNGQVAAALATSPHDPAEPRLAGYASRR
jgi:pimeloyl-ACP methyl ester carboxylesterase